MEKKKKVITVIGRKLWKWDIQMRGQQGKKKKAYQRKGIKSLSSAKEPSI